MYSSYTSSYVSANTHLITTESVAARWSHGELWCVAIVRTGAAHRVYGYGRGSLSRSSRPKQTGQKRRIAGEDRPPLCVDSRIRQNIHACCLLIPPPKALNSNTNWMYTRHVSLIFETALLLVAPTRIPEIVARLRICGDNLWKFLHIVDQQGGPASTVPTVAYFVP